MSAGMPAPTASAAASRAAAAGGQGQETIVRVPAVVGATARMGGATGAGDRLVAAHLAAAVARDIIGVMGQSQDVAAAK